jgi:hypothetical protein
MKPPGRQHCDQGGSDGVLRLGNVDLAPYLGPEMFYSGLIS